jgi:cob(I)alamin adenosyltransferase
MSADDAVHRARMQRRQDIHQRRVAAASVRKGLVIVHTGAGKGKTTAALGMVLRALGHGQRVAIVQFIKSAADPAEQRALASWGEQVRFHVAGEGFSWDTQDRARDIAAADAGWALALGFLADPAYRLVVLDEINVALRQGQLETADVLAGLACRPPLTHVVLTGRGAPTALVERADLVTEMRVVKHPFRDQGVRAQAGIEF